MDDLKGLGKKSRGRLSQLMRKLGSVISVIDAAQVLNVAQQEASGMLSYWGRQGWMQRIKRGIYAPVPIDALSATPQLEDSWIVAKQVFTPCYVGGWSAAEYWDLTEQIFRSTFVYTTKMQRTRETLLGGCEFNLKQIPEKALFGLKKVWRGDSQVCISDPSRTLLDFLNDPKKFGGGRVLVDLFQAYSKSKYRDWDLLVEYAERLGNRAVFKRLGYLLENFSSVGDVTLEKCKQKLSKGVFIL